MTYEFSIDLEAEMAKITGRQHLNDVHYLVQAVRHALHFNPGTIEISLANQRLVFHQDGKAFSEHELALIRSILQPSGISGHAFQEALGDLEHGYGICFLSLFKNKTGFSLITQGRRYTFDGERFHEESADMESGYRFVIEGPRPHASKEMSELRFFCAGISCPILINGTMINESLALKDQIFIMSLSNEHGEGVVGLPQTGDVCQIEFYKAGVRLGSKTFPNPRGKVFHAYWNARDTEFEASYSKSIKLGEDIILDHVNLLYQDVKDHFFEFSAPQKARVKQLALRLPFEMFAESFLHVPLWHTVAGSFRCSMARLKSMHRALGSIYYCEKDEGLYPDYLPVLNASERSFLFQGGLNTVPFDQNVSSLLGRILKRLWRKKPIPPVAITDLGLEPYQKKILERFQGSESWFQVAFTHEASAICDDDSGTTLYVNINDPQLHEVARKGVELMSDEALAVLRLRLFADARDLRRIL